MPTRKSKAAKALLKRSRLLKARYCEAIKNAKYAKIKPIKVQTKSLSIEKLFISTKPKQSKNKKISKNWKK